MIKHLGRHAKQKLLEIYNQSWNSGEFPASWKEAIITPILKKGKYKHNKTSYRPISLLSCLGKTMERMVNRRLQYHLEKNNLINPTQSRFRKNRNTEDQITLLTQDNENGFQQKMKSLAAFVDLTKAFDKVWKEALLLKLLQKNVCGKMYWWIHSYLFQRSARVKLDGQTSTRVKIREGVPQGSCISPTLFIVFIDDITDQLSNHISRALHADDLAIWTKSEQISTAAHRIQDAMNLISNWAREWMVSINRTKTENTCFSLSPKKEVFNLQIEVYTGAVRPHMEYAATAWSSAAKTNIENLAKVQNTAMRLITGGIKTTPIPAMEKLTGIGAKEEHTGAELKSLTLEMLHTRYPNTTWTHVYTDGSAENAVRNGGGGVFIRLPDGTHVSKSVATGHYSTNFRAEATALLTAAKTLNQMENLPDHTAILTDCRALLQSLQTRERESSFYRPSDRNCSPSAPRPLLPCSGFPLTAAF
nr:hypothetical protein BaRGS_001685 [Batillaria attramentaria]